MLARPIPWVKFLERTSVFTVPTEPPLLLCVFVPRQDELLLLPVLSLISVALYICVYTTYPTLQIHSKNQIFTVRGLPE